MEVRMNIFYEMSSGSIRACSKKNKLILVDNDDVLFKEVLSERYELLPVILSLPEALFKSAFGTAASTYSVLCTPGP